MGDHPPPVEATRTQQSQGVPEVEPPKPDRIGRYRVDRLLGKGGFGLVYLAYDEELDRPVTVKVPHAKLVSRPEDAEAYRREARTVANLDHPNIVPVHDVGSSDEFPCFVVSKYVDGTDLGSKLKKQRLAWQEAAELVATVADTLHYAHTRGLVHRDVKPGNMLLDQTGKPFVVDFGLALREQELAATLRHAGTPAYMSPEQARGEGHRVDGRTDIFSLGVVLYELLVGRRPFKADTQSELLEQITSFDPKPPRQHDDTMPKELERICLKALSKRATERYTTAKDLADDLRHFLSEAPASLPVAAPATPDKDPKTQVPLDTPLATPGSDRQPIKIVPKGLRSFDEHDADFFLKLLPGARDRDGLPDSIRFWKTRIEETDRDKTFSVGLIYGPSGCGKSSLVKAGLMPRLGEHVIAVYVEATPDETESRLLRGLRKHCPALPENLALKEMVTALRQGQGITGGKKVLIVLDQFEQWLHAKKEEQETELVQALRQCDGGRVQCVVMVRDDFWLAVSRFVRDLEVRLVEAQNSALVDLFDVDHTRRVLGAFGRAFGRLPETSSETSDEQKDFLKQAASGLAEENKVVCVRLALFAEMMKGRPWTPTVLKEVGGTTGIGVAFLEETFAASTAPPEHRYHQKAARAVLKALLPDSGTDIKGHMRSQQELLHASGYASRPKDFDDLIRVLDGEIRLITPTDPEGMEADDDSSPQVETGIKYYQLTHDYLVPSLRDWLTRKRRETRRGRTEMRLEELAAAWNVKPENRHLPSVVEWLNINLLTPRKQWTEPQRKMLRSASRLHGFRWGSVLLLVLAAIFVVQQYIAQVRHNNLIASTANSVDALQTTKGDTVPFALRDLEKLPPELVIAELKRRYNEADGQRKLTLGYALAELGEVDHEFLSASVPTAGFGECPNIVKALSNARDVALQTLADAIVAADDSEDWAAKARLALVALHLNNPELSADMLRFEDRPDPIQRTVFIETFPKWHGDLNELSMQLRDATDGALRSGISLGIGSIEEVDDQARQAWQDVFSEWYVNQPDAGTHSAAGWALRTWGLELPEIPPPAQPEAAQDWMVTPSGLTMLRIPAGEFVRETAGTAENKGPKPQTVRITRDFFLSDREVSVRLFQQFIEDADYDRPKPVDWQRVREETSPTAEHPVQQVNWYDVVMFCNWLSHREGLTPCYELTGEKEKIKIGSREEENDAWRLIDAANGYRLPSEAQWEYACRAETTTRFAFGEDEATLDVYGVSSGNSNSRAAACGTKLCNSWGLFDMHGNIREWCGDWYASYGEDSVVNDPLGPIERPESGSLRRVHRGGAWSYTAGSCRSSYRVLNFPSLRLNSLGFRVARSFVQEE